MNQPEVWNTVQIATWIGNQLMREPSMFERGVVTKYVRGLGRHPVLQKHTPERKPLSVQQIHELVDDVDLDWHNGWTVGDDAVNRYLNLVRAVEAAHGIK